MRDYGTELEQRAAFISALLEKAGADGIVYGNSGGKDSALVGALCKRACDNTVGILLPCGSRRNYEEDIADGKAAATAFGIETRQIDLTPVREAFMTQASEATTLSGMAKANIAPRLRMAALYAVAASENRLVAGTGNRSEAYVGYFTKWGDGAHDFNPIADLTVTEIYEFLRYLKAPACVIDKAPSAALFDGQTDESEMGITYANIDKYLLTGEATVADKALIEKRHAQAAHKLAMPVAYGG